MQIFKPHKTVPTCCKYLFRKALESLRFQHEHEMLQKMNYTDNRQYREGTNLMHTLLAAFYIEALKIYYFLEAGPKI